MRITLLILALTFALVGCEYDTDLEGTSEHAQGPFAGTDVCDGVSCEWVCDPTDQEDGCALCHWSCSRTAAPMIYTTEVQCGLDRECLCPVGEACAR